MPVVSAWCWFGVVAGSGVEMVGAGVEVVGACVMAMYPGVAAGGAGGREAASASKWTASGGLLVEFRSAGCGSRRVCVRVGSRELLTPAATWRCVY